MLDNLTLLKFAESVSTGLSSGSTGSSNRDGGSVSNTMSKSRAKAGLQKLERDSSTFSPSNMPANNMASKNIRQTSSMSHMEDRRILDRPMNRVGSMKL